MKAYDDSWDRPHRSDGSELWQESDWLSCYDTEQDVGVIFRLGQRPDKGKGQPSLFVFAVDGQRFLLPDEGGMGADCDICAADRWETGCQVSGHGVEAMGSGEMLFRWDYPESAGELKFQDQIYVPRDWSTSGKHDEVVADMNADGHLECSGRVRGEVRIGDKQYRINCFGHRDRSWGKRDQYVSRMRRCLSTWGSVGGELSYAAALMEFDDGRGVTTGFVVRNGVEEDISTLNLLTTMDGDMVTPLAGKVMIRLESDERIDVDCDLKQAFGGFAPGTTFGALGAANYAGETGYCCYSVITNVSRGEHRLAQDEVTGLAITPGLSPSFIARLKE